MTATNYSKLADLYAIAKAEADAAKAKADALKKQIEECGLELIEGDAYDVKVSLSESTYFTKGKLQTLLSADQIAAVASKSLSTKLTIKAHA